MTKQKTNKKTIHIWDYYDQVELATQRLVLIKKALGLKTEGLLVEKDWILETFDELDQEGTCSCEYVSVITNIEEGKQKIYFKFDLAEN